MQPITRESLAANAYRTLGLSGSANQSTIEAAARRMRIWPDPAHIPPTPWDLPHLGPLRRSKSDIEQALATLHQPTSRLQHRLLWYGPEKPPNASVDERAVVERHALLVDSLQGTLASPDMNGPANPWQMMLQRLTTECSSPDLLNWQFEVECTGGFEKPATEDEIRQVVDAIPAALAAGFVPRAMEAFEVHRIDVVNRIAVALASNSMCGDALNTLCDRLEDDFVNRVAEMDRDLRDGLRTNHSEPAPFYSANFHHARLAREYYERHIARTLTVLLEPSVVQEDRADRVKGRAAEVMVLLALGWEWAGTLKEAERVLQQALRLAYGTVVEREVRVALDRVSPLARAAEHRPPPPPKRSWLSWLPDLDNNVVRLAVIVVSMTAGLWGGLSRTNSKPAPSPKTVPSPAPRNIAPPAMPTIPSPSSVRDPIDPPPIKESTGEVNREP